MYGDFVASYVIRHPELVTEYSSYSWHETATTILKEFYKAAGREDNSNDIPAWLDLIAEQTIVQETQEESSFELRGFLRQCVIKSYKDNTPIIPDFNFMVTDSYNRQVKGDKAPKFKDMLDYCLKNKTVSFLHSCKSTTAHPNDIAFTSDIKSEINRYHRNTSPGTMQTIAAKIPGFDYKDRWIGSEKIRVIYGPKQRLLDYLDYEIEDRDGQL